jgi:hypothetical protein
LENSRPLTEVVPRIVAGGIGGLAVALGLVIALTGPGYFKPMYSTRAGLVLLGIGLAAILTALAVTEVAIRIMRRGGRQRLALGLLVWLIAFLIEFVALWIVLIGPAVLTLLAPG